MSKHYKVQFRCPETDKQCFSDSSCTLTISVGQPKHEGEKFSATLEKVNQCFKSCNIMVCDTLQRHSLKIRHPQFSNKQLEILCSQQGIHWLQRNELAIKQLTIPHTITRWNIWHVHPGFPAALKQIHHLRKTDVEFEQALGSSAHDYLNRLAKRYGTHIQIDIAQAIQCTFDYLMEECAAMLLWAEEGYNFEIYPDERNAVMKVVHKKLTQADSRMLLSPIAIYFKTRPAFKQKSHEQEEAHVI